MNSFRFHFGFAKDGVGEEKQCPDGLRFNDKASLFTYPCQYPIDVDCGGRSDLQVFYWLLTVTEELK